jgi:hypothetical protein
MDDMQSEEYLVRGADPGTPLLRPEKIIDEISTADAKTSARGV